MANADSPKGAIPVYNSNGSPWTGSTVLCAIPASDGTATFRGDFVKLAGSSDSATGVPTVIQAAATDRLYGAIVGFVPDHNDLTKNHRVASTLRYCMVAAGPDIIFEMQEDSVGNNMDADMVGLATDIVVGSGNTATGWSAMELDSSDTATAAGQVRILGLVRKADNEIGANAKWLVRINEHHVDAFTTDI
jgi:hypothetical protein